MPMPAIIAHRGYSTLYRENSPAAWTGAMEAGADYIEVDLRMTADGEIVCSHDQDLRRLAGRDEAIAEVTGNTLAGIEAQGFPAAPPLALLFAIVPPSQPIVFDVKDERPASLDILLAALAQHPDRALILGMHASGSVDYVRSHDWTRPVLGLVKTADEEAFFSAGGDILRIWEWDAGAGRIAAHVTCGRPVWITLGEGTTGRKVGDHAEEPLLRMAKEGATGFLANDVAGVRKILDRREA